MRFSVKIIQLQAAVLFEIISHTATHSFRAFAGSGTQPFKYDVAHQV